MLFQGQVRSYNKVVDGAGRLMVTLFVQSMYETSENETLNKVSLTGALCKPPIYRSTPFGREICDMMLAVNRAFGKSDYIPASPGAATPSTRRASTWATSCASRGGCNRANIRNSWKTANT